VDRSLLEVVALAPGDEPELERFLALHADSSMFLRANLAHAGIVDEGEPLQGTYVAARAGGAMVAVAAHCWNGMVIVQGRVDAVGDVARTAVARTGRPVNGFSGPSAQVIAARAALGLADRPATLDSLEDLFTLALDELRVPAALADGRWSCRRAVADDHAELARWRLAYSVEALGAVATPELEERTRQQIARNDAQWVLVVDGKRVATSAFNAQLPDTVQVGGVFTPPELRGRGYGRAVVAGSLVDARARGVQRSILFTGADHAAARTAYLALGYRIVGDYGLVLFTV
jgi:predicted GNAT family acetyltransferase